MAASPASAPIFSSSPLSEIAKTRCIAVPSLRRDPNGSFAAHAGQAGDRLREPGRVVLEHQHVDAIEDLLDPLRVERLALGEQDLLGRGGLGPLVAVEQLLVQLLPRTATDALDRAV